MISLPLTIRQCDRAQREAAGWFVPGDDVNAWLNEIARFEAVQTKLQLYVVPHSANDQRSCGILIIPPPGPCVAPSRRALPYGRMGSRLFLPADARLDPEFSVAELEHEIIGDLLVLHPSAGLINFSQSEVLRVTDLLVRPTEQPVDWSLARPGFPPCPRLLSIEPATSDSVESIVISGRDDIGSEPLDGLPKAPDEPGNSMLHRAGRAIQQKLAQAAHGLGNQLAGKVTKPTWRDRLRDWAKKKRETAQRTSAGGSGILRGTSAWLGKMAARAATWLSQRPERVATKRASASSSTQKASRAERFRDWAWQKLQKVTAAMEAARNREVHRLLYLFDTDPDEALRHAIPLGGAGGVPSGRPGVRLTPHGTDFSLGHVSGWQGTDPWSIEWQVRQRLLEKYRNLANREIRLGRHRRAAYIFAELLGDFTAAAAVLAQGKHFREAAILYRDRLKKPIEAARCLERAGLWTEAVAIYEAERQFETVGDLYVRLQQLALAEQAYRRAVESLSEQQDFWSAAQLLERKLAAHDEALAMLASAWPWSSQAVRCLESYFELLGKLARHQFARDQIISIGLSTTPATRGIMLINVFAHVAKDYPDRAVRVVAADTTRVLAGRHLALAMAAESESLIAAVVGLEPQDKLLQRDGQRYQNQRARKPAATVAPRKPARASASRIQLLQLPRDVTWRAAASAADSYWAAGITESRFVLLRGDWQGNVQTVDWNANLSRDDRVLLAPDPQGIQTTWIHHDGCSFKYGTKFSISEHFARPIHVDAVQRGHTLDFAAIAYDERGVIWQFINVEYQFTLCGFRSDGSLVTSQHIAIPVDELAYLETRDSVRPSLLAHRDSLFIGVGSHLLSIVRENAIEATKLPFRVTGLAGVWSLTRPRIVIALERGGFVFWGGIDHGYMQPIGIDMVHPQAAFARNGTLIVVAEDEGHTYDTNDRKVSYQGHFDVSEKELVAILPTNVINQFALLGADGKVQLFRLS